MSNDPKVLVEFSPEEIAWLADRLHEEWSRALVAGAVATTPEAKEKIQTHKEMEARLRNRLLDKAHDQGFGHL
jgi:hypothetical protein